MLWVGGDLVIPSELEHRAAVESPPELAGDGSRVAHASAVMARSTVRGAVRTPRHPRWRIRCRADSHRGWPTRHHRVEVSVVQGVRAGRPRPSEEGCGGYLVRVVV